MFTKRASNLRQREVLGIVAGQAEPVARRQTANGGGDCQPDRGDESLPIGLRVRADLKVGPGRAPGALDAAAVLEVGPFFDGERFHPACSPQIVDVPLREDRAQPGGQTAAAVEVQKQRPALTVTLGQPEEFGIQGVSGFSRRPCAVDGVRGAIEQRPIFTNEMLPGRVDSVGAGGRQRKVFEVKRARFSAFGHACLEGRPEPLGREPPAVGAGLPIELLNDTVVRLPSGHCRRDRHTRTAPKPRAQSPKPCYDYRMIGPLIQGLATTFKHMFKPKVTVNYPEQKVPMFPKYRGKQVLMRDENGLEKCVACGLCSVACPADAIYLEAAENDGTIMAGPRYAKVYQIHKTRCIFCGMCEEACPVSAIFMGKDYELAVYSKDDFVWDKTELLVPAADDQKAPVAGR